MKRALSIVALLLAVVMIAMCCVGCGDEKKDDSKDGNKGIIPAVETEEPTEAPTEALGIVGKWCYTMQFSDVISAAKEQIMGQAGDQMRGFYEEYFKAFDGVSIDLYMEFGNNSEFTGRIDSSTVDAAIAQIRANIKDRLPAMVESLGVSMDVYEAGLAQQGYTVDDFIDQMIEGMDFENSLKLDSTGQYRLDGDRLYTAGANGGIDESTYAVVEISYDKLLITDIVGDSTDGFGYFKALMPLTFYRVG